MKGLVLSGGYGTRLRPLTHTGPKQLIPIANKPNILYCIEDLRDAGITDIGIILGTVMPEKVEEFLGGGSKFSVKFSYIVQGEPKGFAHAVWCAKDFVGKARLRGLNGPLLVSNEEVLRPISGTIQEEAR